MFGLGFRFPGGRYHATPWGRNVNEADVAWPPEPLRILRALIACYWRAGNRKRWNEEDLAGLIEALAETLPVFRLPEGTIHAHTRHYMPIRKGKSESSALVFDAFLHIPEREEVQVIWHGVTLEVDQMEFAQCLASGMGYLGRAESWTECRVLTDIESEPNCMPVGMGIEGIPCKVLVPRSANAYREERDRLIARTIARIAAESGKPRTSRAVHNAVRRSYLTKTKGGVNTLPKRLLDALSLETADLHQCKWNRPPAAFEAVYMRAPTASPSVVHRGARIRTEAKTEREHPTVARYLLAGRPRPRIEDAVKIGEVMRLAAMSMFKGCIDEVTGKRRPAPTEISGHRPNGRPVGDPVHPHAFWLPEDADGDGFIDHITVFIGCGMVREVQEKLDRITRIWLNQRARKGHPSEVGRVDEWRLALEGFGRVEDFEGASRILATSRRWKSITPFLASGHLKRSGYAGEVRRLLRHRRIAVEGVTVEPMESFTVAGAPRNVLNFHRFRSRGREVRPDSHGAFLEVEFPEPVRGPLALGYASHFGLGMFGSVNG